MSKKCEVCGKGQVSGNNVSHSNRHTRRKWNANIRELRSMTMEQLELLMFVQGASDPIR